MQVTPLPVPALPTNLPQEAVAKTVTNVQAQAVSPLIQRAVDPSTKSDRGNQPRTNGEKAKGGDGTGGGTRGVTLNVKV